MTSLCWALVRASIRGEMQYRFNFLIEMAFGLVYQTIGFAFVWVVIVKFSAIGGWDLGEITLLSGIALGGHCLWALLFTRIRSIDEMVRAGDFDRMFLRPMPALLQFMFGAFSISTLGDVIGAAILLSVGLTNVSIDWSVAKIAFLIGSIIGSGMVKGALQLGPASLTFRFLDSSAVRMFFDNLMSQFGSYPLSLFEQGVKQFLTFIVPVAFLAWIPGAVLLDRTHDLPFPAWAAWYSPLTGVAMMYVAVRLFTHELRHYQSTGS